jgi:hypothetical protein
MSASVQPGNRKPMDHLAPAKSCACMAPSKPTTSAGRLSVGDVICCTVALCRAIDAGVIYTKLLPNLLFQNNNSVLTTVCQQPRPNKKKKATYRAAFSGI